MNKPQLDPRNMAVNTLRSRTDRGQPGRYSLTFWGMAHLGPAGEPSVLVTYYDLEDFNFDTWSWTVVYYLDPDNRAHCGGVVTGRGQRVVKELDVLEQRLAEGPVFDHHSASPFPWSDGCQMLS